LKSVLNKSNLSSSPVDEDSEQHKPESEKLIHDQVIMEEKGDAMSH
jgi:hypothetical protein